MILKRMFVYQEYPENLMKLYQLAYNLWWTWNYEAVNLFYRVDAQLFREVNHNPIKLLYSLPKERINALAKDKGFLFELEKVWEKFQEYLKHVGTLGTENGEKHGLSDKRVIAYFMMECGVHESIPIYAGGLGILCGDYLKSSSDMGLPIVGVGLLYKYGYFSQRIGLDGRQEEVFVEFENHLEPMKEARAENGEPAYVDLEIAEERVKIKLWQIDVGQTRLILLDTDIEDNPSHLRDITHELYVADREKRIQQELVLGAGGMRALEVLQIDPKVYHLNEAHSAFLILARLEKLMKEHRFSFSEARAVIRCSTVFTTHTPVIAGNENFDTELVSKYLEPRVRALGVRFEEFASMGFVEGNKDIFWLPPLAIRFCKFVNAVSRQHRDVSRKIWSSLFPERAEIEIPIDYVTNGVHVSWISEPLAFVFNRYMGPDYVRFGEHAAVWEHIYEIPNEEIWEAHLRNKKTLVPFVRGRIAADLAARGYSESKSLKLASLLNPEYLTVVFARRFAYYKRATLILKDKDRLRSILIDPARPVQLIFAGKAHPADESGKDMIKEIMDFAKEYDVEDRVTFIENYDINIAKHLVSGADVWLNTPARDMEGSGTSGMKAAMNGVLNLSMPEGWWQECFNGKNGWAITAGKFYSLPEVREVIEAEQIYNLLTEEIAERYYNRDQAGVPQEWVQMMKESIYTVGAKFNMNRVVADYMRKLYVPSMSESAKIAEGDYGLLKEAIAEEGEVLRHWNSIEITHFWTDADKRDHLTEGERINAECRVNLGYARPEILKVELFYLYNENREYEVIPMELVGNENGVARYTCSIRIEGYGLQNMNARVKPAKELIEDLHPELIKWKD